jgi:phosphoribosylanthranilate isomerase
MNNFKLYPSLDIVNGQALVSNSAISIAKNASSKIVKIGSPLEVAQKYHDSGVEWLHIVDLDAACGRGSNTQVIINLLDNLNGCLKTQVCGGIRSRELLDKYLKYGCDRVNISSVVVDSPNLCKSLINEYGEYIAVAIDAKNVSGSYHLSTHGWNRISSELSEVIAQLEEFNCKRYVVTDVDRGGTMLQPNVDLIDYVKTITTKPVISGGGVASLKDITSLINVGAEGTVLGQVIHTNNTPLRKFIEYLDEIIND